MSELSILPPTFDYVFVGNEHPIKGIEVLDQLVNKTIPKGRSFALIGNLPTLKKKYKNEPNVYLFGECIGQAKKYLLEKSRVFVLTSYHESFSMVVCEALSLNLAVVAVRMPTLESVYGNKIYYAENHNPDVMYEKMEDALWSSPFFRDCNFTWEESAKAVLD